jgi:hypothetical protein
MVTTIYPVSYDVYYIKNGEVRAGQVEILVPIPIGTNVWNLFKEAAQKSFGSDVTLQGYSLQPSKSAQEKIAEMVTRNEDYDPMG